MLSDIHEKLFILSVCYDSVNTQHLKPLRSVVLTIIIFIMHMHCNIRYLIPTIKFSFTSFRYDARQLRRQLIEVIDQMGEASARVKYWWCNYDLFKLKWSNCNMKIPTCLHVKHGTCTWMIILLCSDHIYECNLCKDQYNRFWRYISKVRYIECIAKWC